MSDGRERVYFAMKDRPSPTDGIEIMRTCHSYATTDACVTQKVTRKRVEESVASKEQDGARWPMGRTLTPIKRQ